MKDRVNEKLKPEAIIFDFGFTLLYFVNPSMEKWNSLEEQGLNLVGKFLLNKGVFTKDIQIQRFIKKVRRLNLKFLKRSFETKLEYTSSYIFKEALNEMKYLDGAIINDFLTLEVLEEMSDMYYSIGEKEWIPFEDTLETLNKISEANIKTAVLSNTKHHNIILKQLRDYNLLNYFEIVVTSAEFGKRKPNIEIFQHTLDKLGVSNCPENCVMIGDEAADMIGGKKAKLTTILINREFKFPFEQEIKKKYQPDYKIDKISELFKYIQI